MNLEGRKLAIKRAQEKEVGCLVTGFRIQYGNNVPKSRQKTKRVWKQNIFRKNIFSATMGIVSVKISARGMRTLDNIYGGLDRFLLECSKAKLTKQAAKLKKQLLMTMKDSAQVSAASMS